MDMTRKLSSNLDLDRMTRGLPVTVQVRPRRRLPLPAVAVGAALGGALAAYLLDPREGTRRRTQAGEQLAGAARRLTRRGARPTRYVQGMLEGTSERLQYSRRGSDDLDDGTLTDKVLSEVFGDPDLAKGAIDVNAEHGVVVLRGEARTPEQIDSIEDRVRHVDGVRDVRNLLHLPKTEAKANRGPRR